MTRKTAILAGFTLWLLAGVFIAVRSVAVDRAGHDIVMRNVARCVAVDAHLQRDVLAARYGLLAHYDPLVAGAVALDAAASDIAARAAARGLDDAGLRKAVAERRAAVEVFKPRNSTLTNSLRYLPVAVAAFERDAVNVDVAAVAAVHDVSALAFAAYVAKSEEANAAVRAGAEALTKQTQALPEPLASDAALLSRHAVRIADDALALQPQVAVLLSPSVAEAATSLQQAWLKTVRAEEAYADRWRHLLWLWSAMTFVLALGVVRALVGLYATLDHRVAQRTAELAEKNRALEHKDGQLKQALSQLLELEGLVGVGLRARTVAAAVSAALARGDVEQAKKDLLDLDGP